MLSTYARTRSPEDLCTGNDTTTTATSTMSCCCCCCCYHYDYYYCYYDYDYYNYNYCYCDYNDHYYTTQGSHSLTDKKIQDFPGPP